MPAKNKVNYRAAAHSDELMTLAASTHKAVIKGSVVSFHDLDSLIRLANDLSRELRGNLLPPPPDMSDPFLTEGPKEASEKFPVIPAIDKLPTVKVPVPEVEEKKKSGFLGR